MLLLSVYFAGFRFLMLSQVPRTDNLPTLICLPCVDKLSVAHQFKQQCLIANDTLKDCLEEFLKTTASTSSISEDTDTITIKQENGSLFKYELAVDNDSQGQWTRTVVQTPNSAVVTKAPGPRKRGRPRKYPNEQGQIDVSPYQRKKPKQAEKEPEALTTLLANGSLDLKQEPTEYEHFGESYHNDDPDFIPDGESEPDEEVEPAPAPRKRGRPRKNTIGAKIIVKNEESDDMITKETMLALSEPLPDYLLNPKTKKYTTNVNKKKYVYEKSHTCETCGASFASNASLQAHIRRHLGIKPFVCSVCGYACVLNMELRRHMMRHTGQRPYKCRVCDRRFGDYGSRQKHERLHMGVRPYQCSLCGKSFTYSYVLANHMLTHTGVKKYSCGPCNKKFTKAHHLKYHNKVHHKELYIQQQLEQEAKKMRRQMNVTGLSGVISGQMVDGTLQFIQTNSEDGDQEADMQGLDEEQEDDVKETDRAVAGMQAVVLDASDFCIDDDVK
ncbi:zinc finger protein 391 isoform X2 [Manduca sexta]|uniref:zinc finger protein 391 isoform X2 n=1 Tax=Manduca sexta TaxID=7130 RepID=UPI001182086D|nr:zinc finger protein 391 isoform X2 [Manduca sexta]